MRFLIHRGSDSRSKEKPCASAALVQKADDSIDREPLWAIDVDTIEAMMALREEVGQLILLSYNYAENPELRKLPVIEIYDGYRE